MEEASNSVYMSDESNVTSTVAAEGNGGAAVASSSSASFDVKSSNKRRKRMKHRGRNPLSSLQSPSQNSPLVFFVIK
jgi:hypothetical protein